mgnify:CR=1 FL=1
MAADVVVVNHHLLFADLALKQEGFGEILPGAQAFVLPAGARASAYALAVDAADAGRLGAARGATGRGGSPDQVHGGAAVVRDAPPDAPLPGDDAGVRDVPGIAGGVLIISLAGGTTTTLNGYLFGSISTVTTADVWMTVVLAAVLLAVGLGLAAHETGVFAQGCGQHLLVAPGQCRQQGLPVLPFTGVGGFACQQARQVLHHLPVAQGGQVAGHGPQFVIDGVHRLLAQCVAHQREQRAQPAQTLARFVHAGRIVRCDGQRGDQRARFLGGEQGGTLARAQGGNTVAHRRDPRGQGSSLRLWDASGAGRRPMNDGRSTADMGLAVDIGKRYKSFIRFQESAWPGPAKCVKRPERARPPAPMTDRRNSCATASPCRPMTSRWSVY